MRNSLKISSVILSGAVVISFMIIKPKATSPAIPEETKEKAAIEFVNKIKKMLK